MRSRVCKAVRAGATRTLFERHAHPGPASLSRAGLRRALAGLACVALPLAGAGCSLPIIALKPAEPTLAAAEEPAATGSVRPRAPLTFGRDLDPEDWRRASAALAVALDPQGNGRPVKWDNPETGLRGAVNPTGLPFVRDDEICRHFLASVVKPEGSRFLRGTGCRLSGAPWELKSLRAARAGA